jgi:uncharacterized membrane protein AbrB (regulator of aidB expression)
VAAGTLAMIAASAGFAWLLAQAIGLHPATVLLGTTPGRLCLVAGMILTAVGALWTGRIAARVERLL